MISHDICGHCRGGIHLETGDLGFGMVTVWEHDNRRPFKAGHDHEPTPLYVVQELHDRAKSSSIKPTTERGISQ